MSWLASLLLAVQVSCALAVIGLVLLQQGKGADMGAAFGSSGGGASGSLFGATGSANFLSRATALAATVFFASTLGLAYLGHSGLRESEETPRSVMEQGPASQIPGSTAPLNVPGNSTIPPASGAGAIPSAPGGGAIPTNPAGSTVPSATSAGGGGSSASSGSPQPGSVPASSARDSVPSR